MFLNEADECIRVLAQDFDEWRHESARDRVGASRVRRAHSFAGITTTVGLGRRSLAIADPLDDLMHELSMPTSPRAATVAPRRSSTSSNAVIERMRGMLHQFAADIFPTEAPLEAAAMHELLAFARAASAIHLADTPEGVEHRPRPATAAEASPASAP